MKKNIYEYWIVTPRLGEKLREKGEVVYETWGGWIWGRTSTGPIMLDSVISSICHADMGILKGPDEIIKFYEV